MNNDVKRFGVATKGFIMKEDKLLILYKTKQEAAKDPNPDCRVDTPGGCLEFSIMFIIIFNLWELIIYVSGSRVMLSLVMNMKALNG